MSTFSFENLWNDATLWAERQSEHIFTQGRSLTPEEMDLARKARVTAPERIRILSVPEVPFPEDPTLRAIAAQTGMPPEHLHGMTLGYGIYIREDQAACLKLRAHEFRHVAQYECFVSIKTFMFFYLKELLHFGYGQGPLEVDADAAEKLA